MKADTFVRQVLAGSLKASTWRSEKIFALALSERGLRISEKSGVKYGFEVEILPKEMDGSRKISSTYIREELAKGNMEKVSSCWDLIILFPDRRAWKRNGRGIFSCLQTRSPCRKSFCLQMVSILLRPASDRRFIRALPMWDINQR